MRAHTPESNTAWRAIGCFDIASRKVRRCLTCALQQDATINLHAAGRSAELHLGRLAAGSPGSDRPPRRFLPDPQPLPEPAALSAGDAGRPAAGL